MPTRDKAPTSGRRGFLCQRSECPLSACASLAFAWFLAVDVSGGHAPFAVPFFDERAQVSSKPLAFGFGEGLCHCLSECRDIRAACDVEEAVLGARFGRRYLDFEETRSGKKPACRASSIRSRSSKSSIGSLGGWIAS